MKTYLKEVSFSVSSLYSGEGNKLMVESRAILYSLDRNIEKIVRSNVKKIAIKLWPIGSVGKSGIPEYAHDGKIFLINVDFDIALYNECKNLSERNLIVCDIIDKSVSNAVSQIEIDEDSFSAAIRKVKDNGYKYESLVGRWVNSPSKKYKAKLKIFFDHESIKLIAHVFLASEKKTKECVISEYDTFNPILCELGKICFIDDDVIKYEPKRYFDSVTCKVC